MPNKANIQFVHSIRNDAQHKAKYPNSTDVSDCRTYARDFIAETISGVWGLVFDSLSLADLVKHPQAQKYLRDAEDAKRGKDYVKAVQTAAAALVLSLNLVETSLLGRRISNPTSSDLQHDQQERRLRTTLVHLVIGLNYADYLRLWQIAREVFFPPGREGFGCRPPKKDPLTEDDAEFVTSYCCDTVIRIEECVGDLDKPFGSDRLPW